MRTLHSIEHHKGSITATIREWEGVGTPDYYTINFTIEAATWAGNKFKEAVDQAKEYNKLSKESRILTLKQEIQMRQDELTKLAKE